MSCLVLGSTSFWERLLAEKRGSGLLRADSRDESVVLGHRPEREVGGEGHQGTAETSFVDRTCTLQYPEFICWGKGSGKLLTHVLG